MGNMTELNDWLASNGGATATDACSGVTWSNDFVALSDDCGATGTATVIFTATDDCGNASTTTATFTIEDTTNPSIDMMAEDSTVECDGMGNMTALNDWLANNGGATASDACGGVTWSNDFVALSDDCGATGTATVIFTATDDCGNASTTTATFTIEDTTNPSIDMMAEDSTVECDGMGNMTELNDWLANNGGATASDACGGVTWSNDFVALSDDCGATGTATVIFTATDDCGNASTTTATFTIEDTTNPSIDMMAEDSTVECDGMGNMTALNDWLANNGGATASDACGGVTWSNDFVALSDDCGATGTATVIFTATDDCGNASTTTATFTIEDTTNPSIDMMASDSTVECDGMGNMTALNDWLADNGGATASDACGGVTWSNDFVALSDDCGATGTATVIFTATDDCGNASTTTATFTIEDTTNPSIDMMAEDSTVECDGMGNMTALNDWLANNGGAAASDVCGGVTWSNDFVALSDDCGATGTATVIFTATDDCGNASTTTATFTIEDTTNPSIDMMASDSTVECDGMGNMTELNDWLANNGGATASDACGGVTWSNDFVALSDDCGATGTATVIFTATDDCGNASTTTATFTIEDTTNPSIDMMAEDSTVECDGMGNMTALNDWLANNGGATASDACSGVTWSNDFVALSDDCGATGSATVIFTATDDCGNASTTTATFTIEDTTNPSIDMMAEDSTVECDGMGNMTELNDWLANNGGATASDVCGGVTWSNDFVALSDDCGATGTATVIFTATDDCGNASSTTATFTIEDNLMPEFTFVPADYTAECSDEHPLEMPTATDNCSMVTITEDPDTTYGTCAGEYVVTRTFTAADDCGNEVTAVQTITIEDNTAPVFDPYMKTVVVECSDGDGNDINYLPITATDNCSNVTYEVQSVCMSGGCLWTIMRMWTATDACGNSTTETQFVMLSDTTAPVVTAPADYELMADAMDCSADTSASITGMPEYSDNCGAVDCWGAASLYVWHEDSEWTYTCTADDAVAEGTRELTRTWYVQDRCGNIGQDTQTITVTDNTAPVGSVMDASVACADYDAATEYGSTMESDNCDSEVAVSWENTNVIPGDGAGCYTVERTYTWVDDCGNESTAVQTITVFDDVAPVITGDIEIEIECSEYPDNNLYVGWSDNCSDSANVTGDIHGHERFRWMRSAHRHVHAHVHCSG